MDLVGNEMLAQVYSNLDIFLVIIARFLGIFVIIPIISGVNIPTISKIGLSLSLSYIVLFSGRINEIYYIDSIAGYVVLIAKEFLVGFTIGYAIYLTISLMYFAGQLVDYQIGFSMVSVLDPTTQIQVPIVGNLFYLIMGMFLIQTGGLHSFISAAFYSYDVLPIGAGSLIQNNEIISFMLQLITNYFIIAMQVSLPIVGSILIIDIALGLLVKAVPQMNIFVVGMPLKLFIGLIILYLIMPIFSYVYDILFDEAYNSILHVIKSIGSLN